MNIFWQTIAAYNSATWFYQIIIILIGLILTLALIYRPKEWIKTAMKVFLAGVYLWISIVYFFIYCDDREYNNVMGIFWAVMALIWIWDIIKGYTTFERTRKYNILAGTLLITTFVYPLLSLARGLTFPGITSPVMPCSIATFTIGLLLMFPRKINLFIVLFLCHWSFIGLSKTYFYDIPEDFILTGASIPALYLSLKNFFFSNPDVLTKPNLKYINWLLILVCAGIGLILAGTAVIDILRYNTIS